jgi:hypothetical protein
MFPGLKGWDAPVEDKSISLFPNQPCSNHKVFHEEFIANLSFVFIHHGKEIKVKIPVNVDSVTILCRLNLSRFYGSLNIGKNQQAETM